LALFIRKLKGHAVTGSLHLIRFSRSNTPQNAHFDADDVPMNPQIAMEP
jgi:hypothetical protein